MHFNALDSSPEKPMLKTPNNHNKTSLCSGLDKGKEHTQLRTSEYFRNYRACVLPFCISCQNEPSSQKLGQRRQLHPRAVETFPYNVSEEHNKFSISPLRNKNI